MHKKIDRVMTLDEMLQGGERDINRILERTKPTAFERVVYVLQTAAGLFFPWMLPVSDEEW